MIMAVRREAGEQEMDEAVGKHAATRHASEVRMRSLQHLASEAYPFSIVTDAYRISSLVSAYRISSLVAAYK